MDKLPVDWSLPGQTLELVFERKEERVPLVSVWSDGHVRGERPCLREGKHIVALVQEQRNDRPTIRQGPLASVA